MSDNEKQAQCLEI